MNTREKALEAYRSVMDDKENIVGLWKIKVEDDITRAFRSRINYDVESVVVTGITHEYEINRFVKADVIIDGNLEIAARCHARRSNDIEEARAWRGNMVWSFWYGDEHFMDLLTLGRLIAEKEVRDDFGKANPTPQLPKNRRVKRKWRR